jgi:hypothetical protein
MFGEILEPLLAFLAAVKPFAEVSRLAVVSKTWRRVSLNALKTANQLNLSGFAESVTDSVVRLALVRVTSENLRSVNLSGCHNISAGGIEDILQYIAETCLGVKEVDVTACSNEAVLRAVATRARAALGPLALDLFVLLRSQGEEGKRCSFSNLGSLLLSPPVLLCDPALAPHENALFQAAAHGTAPEVAMLLSLSFAVGDSIKTFDVNEKDSEGNAPLLLACRSGKFEIAEILVRAGADVGAANKRGDNPLLAAVGAGKLELAEMLVSQGANVETVREDGAGLLSLAIVSQQPEMLKFALDRVPEMLPHQDRMSDCDLSEACAESYFDPARIEAWLRTGASPLGLAGQVGALMASCALESSTKNRLEDVRAFLFHNLDMLQDPFKWPVKHAVQQLASQEAGTMFAEKYADCVKAAGESRFITLINKREKHRCRSIHRAQSGVTEVRYSPDGSKLARAEGREVVVCDASTGFVQKTLSGHNDIVLSVCFSPCSKKIVSGGGRSKDQRGNQDFRFGSGTIRIWDAETSTQIGSPLSGHSDW